MLGKRPKCSLVVVVVVVYMCRCLVVACLTCSEAVVAVKAMKHALYASSVRKQVRVAASDVSTSEPNLGDKTASSASPRSKLAPIDECQKMHKTRTMQAR